MFEAEYQFAELLMLCNNLRLDKMFQQRKKHQCDKLLTLLKIL